MADKIIERLGVDDIVFLSNYCRGRCYGRRCPWWRPDYACRDAVIGRLSELLVLDELWISSTRACAGGDFDA